MRKFDTGVSFSHTPVYRCTLVRDGSVSYSTIGMTTPQATASLLHKFFEGHDRESLVVVLLDTKNKPIGVNVVATGDLNSCTITMPNIFKPAIIANCNAIIVGHNHPSGDPEPSPQDISLTRTIREAGRLLDIELLDHIIVGRDAEYVSLRQRGLGF